MTTTQAIPTPNGFALEDIVKAVVAVLQPPPRVEREEPEQYVPEVAVKTYKAFEDYPDILQAKHCRAILGLSEAKTYEVLNSHKCPSFTVGKRILVRKEAFIDFLLANEGQDLID
ncbi:MAG: hypothetical protein FWC16_00655 [Defluviitaleaceae bacterium]|nr:hypothetical protein [Defluviitaleaceae bacterium]MCL2273414.1 hypothetical protein [Defluviitaleaceae bacterium]